jgi:hypothetical protein
MSVDAVRNPCFVRIISAVASSVSFLILCKMWRISWMSDSVYTPASQCKKSPRMPIAAFDTRLLYVGVSGSNAGIRSSVLLISVIVACRMLLVSEAIARASECKRVQFMSAAHVRVIFRLKYPLSVSQLLASSNLKW